MIIPSYWTAEAQDRDGKVIKKFQGRDSHMENFIEVVRSRKTADLFGSIDEGHVSSALCHLGNLSHQTGRAMSAGELKERTQGNNLTAEAMGRMVEHLSIHSVDFAKTPLTLGVPLTIAPKTESFTGEFAARATPLLTREYRRPFVVPAVSAT